MNDMQNARCVVTTAVSDNEKSLFTSMARDLDVSCNVLMRRLIRYFLDGKISWMDLLQQSKDLMSPDMGDGSGKMFMRTYLNAEQYCNFARRTEEWGSTTSIVLRRLMVLYITGKIKRGDIWQ
jgi:hypothetical protein